MRGILSKYANPTLRSKEETAFAKAAAEKELKRKQWLEKAVDDYLDDPPEYVWQDIDHEDFQS